MVSSFIALIMSSEFMLNPGLLWLWVLARSATMLLAFSFKALFIFRCWHFFFYLLAPGVSSPTHLSFSLSFRVFLQVNCDRSRNTVYHVSYLVHCKPEVPAQACLRKIKLSGQFYEVTTTSILFQIKKCRNLIYNFKHYLVDVIINNIILS